MKRVLAAAAILIAARAFLRLRPDPRLVEYLEAKLTVIEGAIGQAATNDDRVIHAWLMEEYRNVHRDLGRARAGHEVMP